MLVQIIQVFLGCCDVSQITQVYLDLGISVEFSGFRVNIQKNQYGKILIESATLRYTNFIKGLFLVLVTLLHS